MYIYRTIFNPSIWNTSYGRALYFCPYYSKFNAKISITMEHKWSKVPVGALINPCSTTQVCERCGMVRINAYCGRLQYYLPDNTPVYRAGECPGRK